MTVLYKPVLIESAEQAEALPGGTQRLQNGLEDLALGWTALVPIEAEEETTTPVQGFAGVFHVSRPTGSFPAPQRRLVTPWEVG